MALLAQFLLRLTFGMAVGMAIVSPRQVSSGFFRNHLYVTLGLSTLAAIASYSAAPAAFWFAVGAAVASYVGAVCWLYEKKGAGKVALLFIALASLTGIFIQGSAEVDALDEPAFLDRYFPAIQPGTADLALAGSTDQSLWMGYLSGTLSLLSNVSSGLLLGITLAAMFLGHWYLNSPTMELAPLRRLLLAMGAAVAFQAVVSAIGFVCELKYAAAFPSQWLMFLMLRWSFGLVGVAALAWMSWQTLKIPNTQSATGILYVAVIGVFVGELTGLLLSAESAFPL